MKQSLVNLCLFTHMTIEECFNFHIKLRFPLFYCSHSGPSNSISVKIITLIYKSRSIVYLVRFSVKRTLASNTFQTEASSLRFCRHFLYYCSDFRYESNGIFVLGVGFFLRTDFEFLTIYF